MRAKIILIVTRVREGTSEISTTPIRLEHSLDFYTVYKYSIKVNLRYKPRPNLLTMRINTRGSPYCTLSSFRVSVMRGAEHNQGGILKYQDASFIAGNRDTKSAANLTRIR